MRKQLSALAPMAALIAAAFVALPSEALAQAPSSTSGSPYGPYYGHGYGHGQNDLAVSLLAGSYSYSGYGPYGRARNLSNDGDVRIEVSPEGPP